MFMNHFKQTMQGFGSHSNKCLKTRVLRVKFGQNVDIV